MKFPLPTLWFLALFFPFTSSLINAQNPVAAGTNTYPNGAPLDNDEVSIINPANMQVLGRDTTDSNGEWRVDSLLTAITENGYSITPQGFELYPAFPNPGKTHNLIYETEKPALITLEIYDVLGRKVQTLVNERKSPNLYLTQWDGSNGQGFNVAEGVYFAVLSDGKQTRTMKLLKMGETHAGFFSNLSEYFGNLASNNNNTQLRQLTKRLNTDYLIKYHDLSGRTVDFDTLLNLPNSNIQQVRNEIIEWIGPDTLQIAEGDTGMLLISNTINAPTGIAGITSNNIDLFQIDIDGDTLFYWTTNPDTFGIINLPFRIDASFGTQVIEEKTANIQRMIQLYLEVRNAIEDTLWKNPETTIQIGDSTFSSIDGIIQGRMPPGNYSVIVLNDSMRDEQAINTNLQKYRKHELNQNPLLNLNDDVNGEVYLIPKSFDTWIYRHVWDPEIAPVGTDIWNPRGAEPTGTTTIDSIGPPSNLDSTKIKIFIYTGKDLLPPPFDIINPIIRGMPDSVYALAENWRDNEVAPFMDNKYTVEGDSGSVPPLRFVQIGQNNYVRAKKGWEVFYGSTFDVNKSEVSDINQIISALASVKVDPEFLGIRKIREEGIQPLGPYTDYPFDDYAKLITFFSEFSTFLNYQQYDYKAQKLTHLLGPGWRFYNVAFNPEGNKINMKEFIEKNNEKLGLKVNYLKDIEKLNPNQKEQLLKLIKRSNF